MASVKKSRKKPLRQRAEKLLSKKFKTRPKIQDKDIKALVHELQVHQIELEMQNEELRRAQEEIEESRLKYSDLYDFAPVGYFTFSQAGEIVEVNLTGANLLDIERGKLLHRPFSAFVDPESRSSFRDHRLKVLKNGERERCELKLIKIDGKSFYVSLESIRVPHGKSFRIRSAVSDITELKKAQEKAETEHAFRIAVENSILSGIVALDPEGRQSYVNLGFCRMVGRSEGELLGKKPPFAYWPPEELDSINKAFQSVMKGKAAREGLQLRFMRKNGERFDALLLPSPLKDHRGNVIGWIVTIDDITHLKQMEKELRQLNTKLEERVRQRTAQLEATNKRLQNEIAERGRASEGLRQSERRERLRATELAAVLDAVPAAVWIAHDPACLHITGNRKADEVLQLLRGTESSLTAPVIVRPTHFRMVKDGQQLPDEELPMQRAARGMTLENVEFTLAFKDGTMRHMLGNATPLYDEQGQPRGSVAAFMDITERKAMEDRITYLSFFPELNPNPVLEVDSKGGVYYLNAAAKRIFPDLQEMGGRHPWLAGLESTVASFESGEGRAYTHETKINENWYAQSFYHPSKEDRYRIYALDITERKRAEEALEKSKERFELLSETASRLLASDKPQEIVNELCQKVMDYLDCHAFFNYLVDEEKQCLRLNAYAGIPEDAAREIEWLKYGVAICGCAARDGCRIIAENIPETLDPRTDLVRSFGIKAYACHPLFVRERMIGTLSFGTRTRTSFTEDDLAMMKTMTDQVAMAIERKRLLEAAQRRADELDAVFNAMVDRVVIYDSEGNPVKANQAAQSEFGLDIAGLDRKTMFLNFFSKLDFRYPEGKPVAEGDIPSRRALRGEKVINERLVLTTAQGKDIFILVSATPLLVGDKISGAVAVWNDITDREKLLKEVEKSRDELELRVRERTAELAKANEELESEITERKRAEEAVKAEKQRFNDVLEMLPAYLVLLTPDYHVPFANRFFRERFGESQGRRCFEYLFGRGEPCEVCETYTVLKTMAPHEWEWTGPDGRIYQVFDFPFTDTDGSFLILEMGIDITERKQAEKSLKVASLYTRSLIEASLDPLVTISADGKVMDVNEATELVTGVSREHLIGSDFSSYFTDPQKAQKGYKEVFSKGFVRDYPLAIRHTSGRVTEVLYNATVYRDDAGEVQGVFAAARDITERKRAEEALQESENQLRQLSSQLMAAQENERKRVARELHDGLGQILTAIKFRVEGFLQEIGNSRMKMKGKSLEAIIPMVQESVREIRRIQTDLRPSILDDLGILSTITWFCREFQTTYSHIRIEKEIDVQEENVPDSLKMIIYRIMQEALNNISKHSQADLIHLAFRKTTGGLKLSIQDNGRGFNLQEVLSAEGSRQGLGLSSMRERAEHSGGSLSMESAKGKGTLIRVEWPT